MIFLINLSMKDCRGMLKLSNGMNRADGSRGIDVFVNVRGRAWIQTAASLILVMMSIC